MSKKDEKKAASAQEVREEPNAPENREDPTVQASEAQPPQAGEAEALLKEMEAMKEQLSAQEDKFLRLCAEYDNFRRRSKQEKESIYADAKMDTVKALLPVYDNLERALKQDTADEAYKKGVEMTMTGLKKAFEGLGVTEIDAAGAPFDPNVHNAVMHIEDENLGENTVAEVFQAGFMLGDRVIRFAMVKVAN